MQGEIGTPTVLSTTSQRPTEPQPTPSQSATVLSTSSNPPRGRNQVRSAIRDDGVAAAEHGCPICGSPSELVTDPRETAQWSDGRGKVFLVQQEVTRHSLKGSSMLLPTDGCPAQCVELAEVYKAHSTDGMIGQGNESWWRYIGREELSYGGSIRRLAPLSSLARAGAGVCQRRQGGLGLPVLSHMGVRLPWLA